MKLMLFWIIPLYLLARSGYLGHRDGFMVRAPSKIWGAIWASSLAVLIIHYTESLADANSCDRFNTFMALWLSSFSVIHGTGVYLFRKFQVAEGVHSWLEDLPGYSKWKSSDLILGAVVEVLSMLGLGYYLSDGQVPPGTPLSLAEPIAKSVGGEVAGVLGVTGPNALTYDGYLHTLLIGQNISSIQNVCGPQATHAPYGWMAFIFLFIGGPLALIVCFQPLLYSPIWIGELRRGFYAERGYHSCQTCAGRGIHIRNPLLFGTECIKCHGSGFSDKMHVEQAGPTVDLVLVIRAYVRFWACAIILSIIIVILMHI